MVDAVLSCSIATRTQLTCDLPPAIAPYRVRFIVLACSAYGPERYLGPRITLTKRVVFHGIKLTPLARNNLARNSLERKLRAGEYQPAAVRAVEIPKANGGVRTLGIPTVVDRLLQQGIHQVLSPIFEKEFSTHSYGFRPGRSAHDAVRAAQEYVKAGKGWVVDIDLKAFFDQVNHDKLMNLVGRKIRDKAVLKLIGKYLRVEPTLSRKDPGKRD